MKIPLKWLQEYVDITLSSSDLANKLTMAGMEVKGTQVIGGSWENIVVGQIITINPHPNADRLTLPTIDLGTERQTVVCGAPNLRLGDKVAFAYVGAQLIDGHTGQTFCLKSAKIRGVVSEGMVCSEKELGISDSHERIIVLPAEAPVGTPLVNYLGDTVLVDIDLHHRTLNRSDTGRCFHLVARARIGELGHPADGSAHLFIKRDSRGTGIGINTEFRNADDGARLQFDNATFKKSNFGSSTLTNPDRVTRF